MTASGNRVIDKMSSLVDTTRASMAITINYPPSHPLSPERFEVVKQALIRTGVDEVDIVAQGQIPSYAEIVYGLDITEGEELFLDIDLAAKGEIDRGEIVVENILFDFDKYNIKPIYYENLNRLAGFMRNNTDAVIEIAGHTDHIGSNEYNYLLSYRRAKAVKDYLVNKGVSSSSLITRKYGEEMESSETEFVSDKTVGEFTIQVFALENRRSIDYFDDLIGVQEHLGDDGLYRYYVGSFYTKREARSAMQNLREMGYKPFIREKSFFE
jgi:hypothetical protein